jgi:hypothetical protein
LDQALEGYFDWKSTGERWSRIFLSNLPRIFIIHSQQSWFGQGGAVKEVREIEFPDTINMDRFLDQEQGSEEYRLISVANHTGLDPRIQYYMAFCVIDGQWWQFDDESVQAVPYYAVFDENFPTRTFRRQRLQTASLLLYERFSPQTPQSARDEHNTT